MKKVLIGCAIVAVVLAGVLVGGGVYMFRQLEEMIPDTEEIEALHAELIEAHGEVSDYTPPLDGELDPDRFARFVEMRETVHERAAVRSQSFRRFLEITQTFEDEESGALDKFRNVGRVIKGGVDIGVAGMEVRAARDSLLMAAEMGEGEYFHLFAISTFGWLQWEPPSENPLPDNSESTDMVDSMHDLTDEMADTFEEMLQRQEQALLRKEARTAEEQTMMAELGEVLGDPSVRRRSFPMQGSVPERWVAVMEPYRGRLEAALPSTPYEYYLEAAFALGLSDDGNVGWSVRGD